VENIWKKKENQEKMGPLRLLLFVLFIAIDFAKKGVDVWLVTVVRRT
jgi:hypothetical protein